MKTSVAITGVWLRRLGDDVLVEVERDGRWVIVARAKRASNFSIIVEGDGIPQAPPPETQK